LGTGKTRAGAKRSRDTPSRATRGIGQGSGKKRLMGRELPCATNIKKKQKPVPVVLQKGGGGGGLGIARRGKPSRNGYQLLNSPEKRGKKIGPAQSKKGEGRGGDRVKKKAGSVPKGGAVG